VVGVVLAFGAGALISAVSFDLAQEGVRLGGADSVALGLAAGGVTYFLADGLIDRLSQPRPRGSAVSTAPSANNGTALALGAFLDGIPEQMVLGIGLATGGGVSAGAGRRRPIRGRGHRGRPPARMKSSTAAPPVTLSAG